MKSGVWRKLGTFRTKKEAIKRMKHEQKHGAHKGYEWDLASKYVGKSVDPAFSDKDGFEWYLLYRRELK